MCLLTLIKMILRYHFDITYKVVKNIISSDKFIVTFLSKFCQNTYICMRLTEYTFFLEKDKHNFDTYVKKDGIFM